MLFASNVGFITFVRDTDGLTAQHDLYSRPPGAAAAAVYTSHAVALDVPPEPMPTIGAES